MLSERVLPHRVQIVSPQAGATDDWGIAASGAPSTTDGVPAWIERRIGDEDHSSEGDRLIEEWQMLTNYPLSAADTVVWDGKTYTVEGAPAPVSRLRGVDHYEAVLRRTQEV